MHCGRDVGRKGAEEKRKARRSVWGRKMAGKNERVRGLEKKGKDV